MDWVSFGQKHSSILLYKPYGWALWTGLILELPSDLIVKVRSCNCCFRNCLQSSVMCKGFLDLRPFLKCWITGPRVSACTSQRNYRVVPVTSLLSSLCYYLCYRTMENVITTAITMMVDLTALVGQISSWQEMAILVNVSHNLISVGFNQYVPPLGKFKKKQQQQLIVHRPMPSLRQ